MLFLTCLARYPDCGVPFTVLELKRYGAVHSEQ